MISIAYLFALAAVCTMPITAGVALWFLLIDERHATAAHITGWIGVIFAVMFLLATACAAAGHV